MSIKLEQEVKTLKAQVERLEKLVAALQQPREQLKVPPKKS